MMALPALYAENLLLDKDRYTEDEYFACEDCSSNRWEWLPDDPPDAHGRRLGCIRAMSGGTPEHSEIGVNLLTALKNALRGVGNQTCPVFGSDLKIHTSAGLNTFPDVSVACGALNYHRGRRDIVTNPILIAEALSPSTEAYDRGDKWMSYQTIPTLQHYLLLSSDHMRAELYTRQDSGWHFEAWEVPDAQLPLPALNVTLPLSDLYALVDFQSATL